MARSRSRTSQPRPQIAQQDTLYLVNPVQPVYVPHYWQFVWKYVEDAVEHANGELTSEDIYNYLLAERMYLWVIRGRLICGACVCEVAQYVRKHMIRVVTLGGDNFDAWGGKLDEALQLWAERIGASGVEAYVRKGLVPKLEALGYRQIYVGMAKNGQGSRLNHDDPN